jgi:multicomponent Na+:H+ antiporter subunit G
MSTIAAAAGAVAALAEAAAPFAAAFFFILGVFFTLTGQLGLLRSPDPFTRMQTSSTCSTTAVLSFLIAAGLLSGFSPFTGKILAVIVFSLITGPVSSHIIARYAWEEGIVPWRKPK